jgi:hypothetical protein
MISLSFKCFNLYYEASNNYKLTLKKYSDTVLCIISTSKDPILHLPGTT